MGTIQSINLLPPKRKVVRESKGFILILVLLLTVVLIVAQWVLGSNWRGESAVLSRSLKEMDKQIIDLKVNGTLLAKINAYNEANAFVERIENNRTNWLPYISAVVGPLGSNDLIKQITADEGREITIELDFQEYTSLVLYMKKLEDDNRLKNIKLETAYTSVNGESAGKPNTKKEIHKLKLVISLEPAGGKQS
ncbi:hypothetical protein I6N90_10435 [Paenibacillus sp. GSMTC-2017]|uniref:hypothetical protein n=1 Tax=Paenibacillus sp. GSMTC-2017 TaxID=2794350 RepID=UPI0018D8AE92|nr:hypothetical protein [Paenibacillus sp. GSMTC-2017]MBH5318225.1 hypothetical protein [Paenibacillus sp. GSMTC-2017]